MDSFVSDNEKEQKNIDVQLTWTKEEIDKWVSARKKKFPTEKNI